MMSVIDMFRAEGEAVGEARGEATGLIKSICSFVASGDLSRERAVARLKHLVEQRQISNEQAEQAIRTLG